MSVRADALRANYTAIAEAVGASTGVLLMVKANAYGLGMREVVGVLEPFEPWGFGVATAAEGIELRESGVTRPILVCSPMPEGDVAPAVAADLQISISSLDALRKLDQAAEESGATAAMHIDVDTGMGRSGFDWRTAADWLPSVRERSDRVEWVGCYTHLHSADADAASIREQWGRFEQVLGQLDDDEGPGLVHVLNSAGIMRFPALGNAVVRPGIYLYGGRVGEGQPDPDPVVSLHARVVHIREASPGTTLGYGVTHRAKEAERWATLSIGYGDGLPRVLGNRGYALLRGTRVPIVGRISMDVTVVDISGVSGVREGDVATLIGSEGGESILLDEVAQLAGTISYEVLTGLSPRLPRVWVAEGSGS
ncbi:MAG: alanine racemase [Gemmatimonadota bacterium]|nr:alanine racemase [Gemmatimonadota bacterium]